MVDCHCHLDTFVRSGEIADVLSRAELAGVNGFVAAGTDVGDWDVYRDLAAAFPRKVFYTVGLHPTEVGEDFEEKLAALESFFSKTPAPVAVGEIGLDGHWLPEDASEAARVRALRREAFARQLALAKQRDLPVVVHAREAFREAVEVIDAAGTDWRRVDFHCFAEGAAEMREILERGGRASFTGTLTYKNAENVRAAALAQGADRLMLETDCPYLSPQKFRGKRNEPAHLRATLEFAAELFGVPVETLDGKTEAATRGFFGI